MTFTEWILVLIALYLLYYLLIVVRKAKFYAPPGEFKGFLLANCPKISQRYWPASWCYHTFLITRNSSKARSATPKLKYHREYIDTPDGGLLSIDWYDPDSLEEFVECPGQDQCRSIVHTAEYSRKPIVLFVPGIAGTSQAEYIRTLAYRCLALGYRVVSMNYRGLARTPLKTLRMYCAASHDDLETVLRYIRVRDPETKLLAAGFSMGGTVLAGYLAHAGERSLIDCAFLASVCWDCAAGVANLERGLLNPIINKKLVQLIFKVLRKHVNRFAADPKYDIGAAYTMTTLRQFDETFTVKMFDEYRDVDDYYAKCSYRKRTAEIRVPTVCVQAADDIFAPEAYLPDREQLEQRGGKVAMLVTSRGGHLGFMEGVWPFGEDRTRQYYSDRIFEQFARAIYSIPRERIQAF